MQELWKSKIKDFNSTSNDTLFVIDYWSKKIVKYFHLRNPNIINLSGNSITQDVKNLMHTMEKHVKYMEQVMIELQDKFIESYNYKAKQLIFIDQLVWEKFQLNKPSTNFCIFKNMYTKE